MHGSDRKDLELSELSAVKDVGAVHLSKNLLNFAMRNLGRV